MFATRRWRLGPGPAAVAAYLKIEMLGLSTARNSACYFDREFRSDLVRGLFVCIYISFDGMYLILGLQVSERKVVYSFIDEHQNDDKQKNLRILIHNIA